MAKYLRIEMPDGSKWDVPVDVVARSRAAYYAHEFGGDIERSLKEDTLPLFEDDDYHIHDWAANDMNWDDVKDVAVRVQPAEQPDYQEGWMNGEYVIVEK